MARFSLLNQELPNLQLRDREMFVVNFAHGEKYENSAIPNCQRMLNVDSMMTKSSQRQRAGEWREWMAGLGERQEQKGGQAEEPGPRGGPGHKLVIYLLQNNYSEFRPHLLEGPS